MICSICDTVTFSVINLMRLDLIGSELMFCAGSLIDGTLLPIIGGFSSGFNSWVFCAPSSRWLAAAFSSMANLPSSSEVFSSSSTKDECILSSSLAALIFLSHSYWRLFFLFIRQFFAIPALFAVYLFGNYSFEWILCFVTLGWTSIEWNSVMSCLLTLSPHCHLWWVGSQFLCWIPMFWNSYLFLTLCMFCFQFKIENSK